ncbi:hypothetical protein AZS32_004841, partial [Salmonella enterica subsp. enterica serovar Ohio]|nr:hypothetical protein [Salmonella enterica subsp. enterica serovar Ohio]
GTGQNAAPEQQADAAHQGGQHSLKKLVIHHRT